MSTVLQSVCSAMKMAPKQSLSAVERGMWRELVQSRIAPFTKLNKERERRRDPRFDGQLSLETPSCVRLELPVPRSCFSSVGGAPVR